MPSVDLSKIGPKFTQPELLRHPMIPKPLHGVAPRIIMGQEWWDVQRHIAYAGNGGYCYACGGEGPLDAHEVYEIDFEKATSEFKGIVALCRLCHDFIHIGRLGRVVAAGKAGKRYFRQVVEHGHKVLTSAGLKPHWGLRTVLDGVRKNYVLLLVKWMDPIIADIEPMPRLKPTRWDEWRMKFDGQWYGPREGEYEE